MNVPGITSVSITLSTLVAHAKVTHKATHNSASLYFLVLMGDDAEVLQQFVQLFWLSWCREIE
jgi:hypothetical protein